MLVAEGLVKHLEVVISLGNMTLATSGTVKYRNSFLTRHHLSNSVLLRP
jgi:hypothetical protein